MLGLLDVDDEFFVLLRPTPGGVALMVSDAVAALDYDVAADVLDLLRVELPDDDDVADAPPWPEGDLAILADLGLPADELEVLAAEVGALPGRAARGDRAPLRVRARRWPRSSTGVTLTPATAPAPAGDAPLPTRR